MTAQRIQFPHNGWASPRGRIRPLQRSHALIAWVAARVKGQGEVKKLPGPDKMDEVRRRAQSLQQKYAKG